MSDEEKAGLAFGIFLIAFLIGFGFFIRYLILDGNHRHAVNLRLSAYVEQCAEQKGSIYEKYFVANNETDDSTIVCIKGTELSKFDNR